MEELRRCIREVNAIPENLKVYDFRPKIPLWLNQKTEWSHHLGLRDLTHAVVCKDELIKLDIDKVSNEYKNKFIKENLTSIGSGASLWRDILYDKNRFNELANVLKKSDSYTLTVDTYVENPLDMCDQYTLSVPHSVFGRFWETKFRLDHWW